jgi:hypothetical protein
MQCHKLLTLDFGVLLKSAATNNNYFLYLSLQYINWVLRDSVLLSISAHASTECQRPVDQFWSVSESSLRLDQGVQPLACGRHWTGSWHHGGSEDQFTTVNLWDGQRQSLSINMTFYCSNWRLLVLCLTSLGATCRMHWCLRAHNATQFYHKIYRSNSLSELTSFITSSLTQKHCI